MRLWFDVLWLALALVRVRSETCTYMAADGHDSPRAAPLQQQMSSLRAAFPMDCGCMAGTACLISSACSGLSGINCALAVSEDAAVWGDRAITHALMSRACCMHAHDGDAQRTRSAGRTMTLTKPALRSSLGNTHFKQAAWVAFNSPVFHEIDIIALVKRWKADGHLSAVMKDASGPRAKEVLERKAQEHKVSFLS